MSVLDGFVTALKLNDDYEDDSKYLDNDDYKAEQAAMMKAESDNSDKKLLGKARPAANKRLGNGMEVCVIKPNSFDDAKEVIDTLLSNRPVVLNMESVNSEIALRIFDVVTGGTYAINGKLQKIANNIFIITPSNVDISGDFQGVISESF